MNNRKGNEFTEKTKLKLAQRVGYRCSFPKCHRLTVGPIISSDDGVHIVGRACHIESAASGGPRFNSHMTSDERRNIRNGIWCCPIHSDIIDNDINLFSVSTLIEWKRIAESYAYQLIDTSYVIDDKPYTLVQLSESMIFKAIWYNLDVEKNSLSFLINDFIYGSMEEIKRYIANYDSIDFLFKYIVIESSGYGLLLEQVPILDEIEDKKIISFIFQERFKFTNPNDIADIKVRFTDDGFDFDLTADDDELIKGKDAVIQSIQMMLGSNQGQWDYDLSFGSFLFKYYKDYHKNHDLLERLIKLEISRKTSIPEGPKTSPSVPISTIKWVDSVVIKGHSKNLLEIDLKLYFSDDDYFSKRISVPASV